jgi:hypothetical protein
LSSNYAFAFAEGDADKSISGISNQIIDDDNYPTEGTYEEISGATVMIKTPLHGDQLSVNAGGLPSGITAVLSNDGTSVTLSGSTTALKYQEALKQINFSNVHENPIPGAATSRDIEIAVVVSDSRGRSSDEVVTTVTLTDENDAPVLSLSLTTPSTFTVNFTEADDATANVDVQYAGVAVVGNNIVITDIDDTLLSIVYLEMSNAQPEDVLKSFDTLPDGIIEFPSGYDAVSGKFRMALFAPLGATAEDFNTALKMIRYSNNSDTPDTTDRIISITFIIFTPRPDSESYCKRIGEHCANWYDCDRSDG